MHIKKQKYIIISVLVGLNLLLSTTFIIYINHWYVYLCILSLASGYNSFSCLLNIGNRMFCNETTSAARLNEKNYLYIVPCYTESEDELRKTLNSLILQREVKYDIRAILIICDGTSFSKNNICDKVLEKILNLNYQEQYFYYPTWDKKGNYVQVYTGSYSYLQETLTVILLVKVENYGKRDSLVLVRSLCYQYNQSLLLNAESVVDKFNVLEAPLTLEMLHIFNQVYQGEEINYIVGTDADTVLEYNCTYELIQSLQKDPDVHGCVGYVDIALDMKFYSLFVLYQYAEYLFAQCLRRQTQSQITHKVNCLSGCVQILRVSEETCGAKILDIFNYLPQAQASIFKHIRSYASEDRNHVCNMLSMYPHVKTTQNLNAIAYTTVPVEGWMFLSQRRRWSLGANTNDMLLLYLPGIVWMERISAFINIFTYSFSPFIFIATAFFWKALILEPTYLMLYLSSLVLLPIFYALVMIPIFVKPLSFRETLYWYLSYIFFFGVTSIVNLIIYTYSICCMDVIKWGKTRQLVYHEPPLSETSVRETSVSEASVSVREASVSVSEASVREPSVSVREASVEPSVREPSVREPSVSEQAMATDTSDDYYVEDLYV